MDELHGRQKIIAQLVEARLEQGVSQAIQTVISKEYEVKNCPPPRGKDVNDYLCRRLGIPIRGAKGKEQER